MKNLASLIFSAIFCLIAFSGSAQQEPRLVKRNTIFLEGLGNGGYYSLNYDRILTNHENWKLAGRVGASYTNSFDDFNQQWFTVPLELSYLRGHNHHFLEIGIGATPMYGTSDFDYGPWEEKYKVVNLDLWVMPRIGYRYQMEDGGFFFKIGFTPVCTFKLHSNWAIYPNGYTSKMLIFGGIALGHTF